MKKQKSPRQMSKELGVSHSYLSQVKSRKPHATDKVVSILIKNGKQNIIQAVKISPDSTYGEVLELIDRHDLWFYF